MTKLALIGKNISHSRSQEVYENILGRQIDYTLLDFPDEEEISSLKELFTNYEGVSITSPYKTFFLNKVKVGESEKKLGAINCLIKKNNEIIGKNTDYDALNIILPSLIKKKSFNGILVLGSGTMANITKEVLEKNNFLFEQISRKTHGVLENIDCSQFFQKDKILIINTCSRNFSFNGVIPKDSVFYDYNYNFQPHMALNENCDYRDGMELLRMQAEIALRYWSIN